MTKEQEKAIKICKNINAGMIYFANDKECEEFPKAIETVLSMLKEKDKEIEEKDKQIDLMAEYIANRDNDEDICTHQIADWCKDEEYGVLVEVCRKCIKQYFERKCEE